MFPNICDPLAQDNEEHSSMKLCYFLGGHWQQQQQVRINENLYPGSTFKSLFPPFFSFLSLGDKLHFFQIEYSKVKNKGELYHSVIIINPEFIEKTHTITQITFSNLFNNFDQMIEIILKNNFSVFFLNCTCELFVISEFVNIKCCTSNYLNYYYYHHFKLLIKHLALIWMTPESVLSFWFGSCSLHHIGMCC